MAKTFTVNITDAEEKAFAWDTVDPDAWVQNAVKEKCRKAKERLHALEIERMTDDESITSIPADKDKVINDANAKTAKQRADEAGSPV